MQTATQASAEQILPVIITQAKPADHIVVVFACGITSVSSLAGSCSGVLSAGISQSKNNNTGNSFLPAQYLQTIWQPPAFS